MPCLRHSENSPTRGTKRESDSDHARHYSGRVNLKNKTGPREDSIRPFAFHNCHNDTRRRFESHKSHTAAQCRTVRAGGVNKEKRPASEKAFIQIKAHPRDSILLLAHTHARERDDDGIAHIPLV